MVFGYAYNLELAVKKLDTKRKVVFLQIKLNARYTNKITAKSIYELKGKKALISAYK